MEDVQERALHFMYADMSISYEALLERATMPTLRIRRLRTKSVKTFKIMNNLLPLCLRDIVTVKSYKYTFRYKNILGITASTYGITTNTYGIRTSTYGITTSSYGKNIFHFVAATLWNSLPNHFRTENSLVRTWNGFLFFYRFCIVMQGLYVLCCIFIIYSLFIHPFRTFTRDGFMH